MRRPKQKDRGDRKGLIQARAIERAILVLRGQRVILDADLAKLYGAPTKTLNQAVRRNRTRFPADFAFRLTQAEKQEVVTICDHLQRLKFSPALPYAFTEHGALMAANLMNSDRAVEMSVYVIRAFVKMRAELVRTQDLARRLAEIEKTLIGHDAALRDVFAKIRPLLLPELEPKRQEIGFEIKEARARYGVHRKRASG